MPVLPNPQHEAFALEVASGSKVSAPNALRRSPDRRIRRKSPCEDFGFAAKTYQEWLTRPFFDARTYNPEDRYLAGVQGESGTDLPVVLECVSRFTESRWRLRTASHASARLWIPQVNQ